MLLSQVSRLKLQIRRTLTSPHPRHFSISCCIRRPRAPSAARASTLWDVSCPQRLQCEIIVSTDIGPCEPTFAHDATRLENRVSRLEFQTESWPGAASHNSAVERMTSAWVLLFLISTMLASFWPELEYLRRFTVWWFKDIDAHPLSVGPKPLSDTCQGLGTWIPAFAGRTRGGMGLIALSNSRTA